MIKRTILCVLAALALTVASAQDVPEFYGYMRISDTWGAGTGSYVPKYGFYRITTDNGVASFTRLTEDDNREVTDGGIYANNRVHMLWTEVIKAFLGTYRSSFRTYDGESLALTGTPVASENDNVYCTSMTYDYISGKAFLTAPKGYGSDGNPDINYELKTIDLTTGKCTAVGDMGCRVKGIAADASGQLWGVGNGTSVASTYLYKIDKQTGKATQQCLLDFNYFDGVDKTSLISDFRTGRLYIVCEAYTENADKERTFHFGIYHINTATGHATLVSSFPGSELFIGCYLRQSHPKAPASPSFTKDDVTAEGIKFNVPDKAFDGTSLAAASLTAEISIDGAEPFTVSGVTPGASKEASFPTALAAGSTHTVSVVIRNTYGPSVPTTESVFIGSDAPAPVTGISVKASDNYQTALVTWLAPGSGAQGGKIDPSKLTYRISRKPDNKVLAEGLTSCEYTDHLDREMGVTQYQIEAIIDGKASESAYSKICTLGTPHAIPYLQTFSSYSDWMSFSQVDNNGDGDPEVGGMWFYDYENQVAMYFTDTKHSADDYLFSPTLQLDPKKVYRLQFQAWGQLDNGSVNHVQVHLATDTTVASTTATILDDYFPNKTQAFAYGLFTPKEGDCRLAFHNLTDIVKDGGYDHLYLDNILVEEYGSVSIPAAPTGVEAARLASGNIRVRFVAPTLTVSGASIAEGAMRSIDVFQAGNSSKPLASIADPVPGQQYEVVITPSVTGQLTIAVSALTAEGRGMEAYAITDTRNDIPAAVTDIKVEGKNAYTIAEITWSQSPIGVNGNLINLDDITYNIYRMVGVSRKLIAEGVKGASYTDRDIVDALGGVQQDYISYIIEPETDGGKGATAQSATTLLGRSYDLPYAESFASQQYQTEKWSMENMVFEGGSWGIASTGYDPYTTAQDADNGLMTFSTSRTFPQGQADLLSPRIDVSNYSAPTLTFYVFRGTKYNGTPATLQAGIYTPETGSIMLSEVINVNAATDGWQRVEMAIPSPFAESNHLQLAFRAYTSSYTASVHIDNISLTGTRAEYEVKAERIAGNNECVVGQPNEYTVYVRNVGSRDVATVNVSLSAGNELIGTQSLDKLAASDMQPVKFAFTPSLGAQLGTLTLTAAIDCQQDGSDANNTITTTVDLIAPMLPLVNDLTAVGSKSARQVALTWSENTVYPRQEYVTEDCESVTPFAIQDMNGWTTIDVDGAKTTQTSLDGSTILEWEHSGEPQAWIAFHIQRAGMDGYATSHSGSQTFVSFESTAATGNDDWLISPRLSGEEQSLSFYAKIFYPYLTDEMFEIWVSRSVPDDITAFEKVSGASPVVVSSYDEWKAYRFTLPEGTRYAAIRCVSKAQYGLMIDDITFSPAHSPIEFWGYNVYRDGELITPEPIAEPSFTDTTFDFSAVATYHVTALYDQGESIFSNPAIVDPDLDAIDSVTATAQKPTKFVKNGQLYIRTTDGTLHPVTGTR